MSETLPALETAAAAGDAAAQEQLADLLLLQGSGIPARGWLERASERRPGAAAKLGLWDIAGQGIAAPAPQQGAHRILSAASSGDVLALRLGSIVLSGGIGIARDVDGAIALLRRAAFAGDAAATQQLSVLDSLEFAWWTAPIVRQRECEAPSIESLPQFLPVAVCAHLIERAKPLLVRAKTVERDGQERVTEARTNSSMHFGVANSDVIIELVNLRVALATGLPVEHQEGLGILNYLQGESYAPHVDWLAPGNATHQQLLQRIGQRVLTLVVFLNSAFTGGETDFVLLDRRFKLPAGGGLLWSNVTASGDPDPYTLHSGLQPLSGEKWLLSKWVRSKPIRPGAV